MGCRGVFVVCVFCVRAVVLGFSRDFFPMGFFLWFFPGGCGLRPPKFSLLVDPSSVCLYMCMVILVLSSVYDVGCCGHAAALGSVCMYMCMGDSVL